MNRIVITGGAGFIGINLARELARNKNNFVVIYDNLSRKEVKKNLEWILSLHLPNIKFVKGDIGNYSKLKQILKDSKQVYHLAAQVAVTTSVLKPIEDFEINAAGTLYVLEACRLKCPEATIIFSSTNKVYGELLDISLREGSGRYHLKDLKNGIDETRNLDFHSPYGNSKGSADQYVRDYHRIYGMHTVVFRQSCIFGEHQHGNEDQGWLAHFVIQGLRGKKITIYGNGKQVRDVLYVSDLISAYKLAAKKISKSDGRIYNIGGGINNTFSLLELMDYLKKDLGINIEYSFDDWRPGDQKIYVSNNAKLERELGWSVRISKAQGMQKLVSWIKKNKRLSF